MNAQEEITGKTGEGFVSSFVCNTTKALNKELWGIGLNFVYYPVKKIGVGLNLNFTGFRTINETYSYTISEPAISNSQYGIVCQYNLIQSHKILTTLGVSSGLSQINLGDKAILVKAGGFSQPKTITSDYYFAVEPGLSFSYKTWSAEGGFLWFTAGVKYCFLISGKTEFGSSNEFSNYLFFLGVSSAILK
ncbi:MAG TPA: hypothetical protein VK806_08815 [Bacteroidia bacterium]|jgi:hypothetical protein|nr:hypothetical protein [Bacteroidia bacterium]